MNFDRRKPNESGQRPPLIELARKDVDIKPFIGENHRKLDTLIDEYSASLDLTKLPKLLRDKLAEHPLLPDPFPARLRDVITVFYQTFQGEAEKGLEKCLEMVKIAPCNLYNDLHNIEHAMQILLVDPDIKKGLARLEKLKSMSVTDEKLSDLAFYFEDLDHEIDYKAVTDAIDYNTADIDAASESKRFWDDVGIVGFDCQDENGQ
jgi:hypothetical protein